MSSSHDPTSPRSCGEQPLPEHRRHDRYPAYFNVLLTDPAEQEPPVSAFIANISEAGMGIVTPVAIAHGRKVKMQVGDTVQLGEVVYSNAEGDCFRTGIGFPPPASGASGVSKLLRNMLIEQPPADPVNRENASSAARRAPARRHLRHSVSATLRILWQDGALCRRVVNAEIENTSPAGARLRVDEQIPVQSRVFYKDETLGIKGTATVCYCRFAQGKYDIGLEFAGSR